MEQYVQYEITVPYVELKLLSIILIYAATMVAPSVEFEFQIKMRSDQSRWESCFSTALALTSL